MAPTTYIFSFCGHIGRVGPGEAAAETPGGGGKVPGEEEGVRGKFLELEEGARQ